MRNSNPQFFLFFFEGIMPTLRRDSKTGPGFAFRLPPQHSRFSAKLVTIVTVTVLLTTEKEGVIIPLYSMNYPFQKL